MARGADYFTTNGAVFFAGQKAFVALGPLGRFGWVLPAGDSHKNEADKKEYS